MSGVVVYGLLDEGFGDVGEARLYIIIVAIIVIVIFVIFKINQKRIDIFRRQPFFDENTIRANDLIKLTVIRTIFFVYILIVIVVKSCFCKLAKFEFFRQTTNIKRKK